MPMNAMSTVPAKLQAELEAEIKRLEAGEAAEESGDTNQEAPTEADLLQFKSDDDGGEDGLPTVDDDLQSFEDAGDKQPDTNEGVDYKALYEQEKQRNEVLNGKYMAEVPRLNHRLKVAEDDKRALEARVKALDSKGSGSGDGEGDVSRDASRQKDAGESTSSKDPADVYELTKEEREYGPDVISMAEKIARQIVEREIGPVNQTFQQQRQDRIISELNALVPDWAEVNTSTEFAAFCDSVEPYSGLTNQQIMNTAQASGDAVRIASVFERFKGNSTTVAGGQNTSGGPTAIEKQVMPGPAPTPPSADGRKTYTLADYSRIMDNITKGLYPPDKAETIRRELLQAATEGRVK